jgi:guanosine-3',5'-bis(diphosphate) 3'-pyrophosphohydrolase
MAENHSLRDSKQAPRTLDELNARIKEYYPNADFKIIEKAFEYSERAHSGQVRRSGEPYFSHPLAVAGILTDIDMDIPTIATGLLHDTVEDTKTTLKDIHDDFGEEVASLVDGVTKISQINFRHTHEKQGENIRKMIVAMGKDIRVILVKLADRMHNMRTLNHMPYNKQAAIAQETIDIYAPLAHRLGISAWKVELEDLSLRYLKPDTYYDLAQKVEKKAREREKYIDDVIKLLTTQMEQNGLKCDIHGRPKHLYSIFKKMDRQNIDYSQVYDVLAFRILVDSVAQCYEALGAVHSLYKPIPGRFKDFIAMAKANNYQSLHTTVIGPGGDRVEIQIRTHEMHLIAERGIAAHWKYKEGGKIDPETEKKFNWLRQLLDWHRDMRDSDEFLESVKSDLFESEIYVFTPKGEVKEFPEGSTPVDFAYSIHTDVGHHTVGAKVNGRIVPLKYKLKNGDTVSIVTSKTQTPSKDWLKFCMTSRAKSKIRAFVRTEERKRSMELGKDFLEKEFRKHGLKPSRYLESGEAIEKYLKEIGAADVNELYVQVGYGKVIASKVIEKLVPEKANDEEPAAEGFLDKVFKGSVTKKKKTKSQITVGGMTDVMVRYAKCCNPIPGDPIVGFISRGRGITIHQVSCPRVYSVDLERRIDVEWRSSVEAACQTKIQIVTLDTPGMLKQMSECFATHGVNIFNAQIRTNKDQKAMCTFDVKVKDTNQLSLVMRDLQKIKGVLKVDRISFS